MADTNEGPKRFFAAVLLAWISCMVGVLFSDWCTERNQRRLAVRNGAACWKADEKGRAYLDWLCDGQPDKE